MTFKQTGSVPATSRLVHTGFCRRESQLRASALLRRSVAPTVPAQSFLSRRPRRGAFPPTHSMPLSRIRSFARSRAGVIAGSAVVVAAAAAKWVHRKAVVAERTHQGQRASRPAGSESPSDRIRPTWLRRQRSPARPPLDTRDAGRTVAGRTGPSARRSIGHRRAFDGHDGGSVHGVELTLGLQNGP